MRAQTASAALVLATLAGCPATATPVSSAAWASGSRLRARVERASDGTAHLVGWHDTVLDVDCAFARDTAGTLRCLPTTTLDDVYLDAACSRRAQRLAPCAGPAPRFATIRVGEIGGVPCDDVPLTAQLEVHALDVAGATTSTYFYGPAASCVAAAQPAAPLVADTGVVDPSVFAAATTAREPLAGRLEAEVVTSEDGARERVAFFDTTLARRCTPETTGLFRVDACVPWPSAGYAEVIPWRADAACSHVLGHAGTVECPAVALLLSSRDASGCLGPPELRGVGAVVTQPIYEGRDPAGCTMLAERPDDLFVELGPPLDAEVLARTTGELRGSGAARARVSTRDGVTLAFAGWELPSGTPCTATRFVDGTLRCLPPVESVETSPYFEDAGCTRPVFGGAPCDPATVGLHTDDVAGCGEVASSLVALDPAPDVVSVFVRDPTGACVADTTTTGAFTRIGAPLPLDTFPTLEVALE